MSDSPTQIFLRDLDKKLWTAADRLIAGTLDAIERENPSRAERDRLTDRPALRKGATTSIHLKMRPQQLRIGRRSGQPLLRKSKIF